MLQELLKNKDAHLPAISWPYRCEVGDTLNLNIKGLDPGDFARLDHIVLNDS